MSNFTEKDIYEVYEKFLPSFVELANMAIDNDVIFEVTTYRDGEIALTSRDYFEKSGKEYVRVHQITQSRTKVSKSSRTYLLKGDK